MGGRFSIPYSCREGHGETAPQGHRFESSEATYIGRVRSYIPCHYVFPNDPTLEDTEADHEGMMQRKLPGSSWYS